MTTDQIGGSQQLARLQGALESTPTGLALLSGSSVLPITESARTDVTGVTQGTVNIYRSGSSRVLQVFDMEGTGGPGWFEVTLS